ncbi:MAG: eCIS core domain-containing protein, partial [Polyangia bacterium]
MQRLFDHDVAIPQKPAPDPARQRRVEDEPQVYGRAPGAVWALLLDRGVDPLALADLLRDGLSASERRNAYLELVRDLGAPIAGKLWREALAGTMLSRGELPADARRIAEAALGQGLPRVDVMSGPLVDAVTARIGSPAYTLGRQVFVRGGETATPVLVHEAIHAAQQQRASARRAGAPSEASEREAHRILRRLGPLDASPSLLADRARASMAVRAALGRAPRVTARPLQLAAYEATHHHVDSVLGEAKRLADALVALIERGAPRSELQRLLGPDGDGHQARVRATAMHALGGRRVLDGRDARTALAEKLGGQNGSGNGNGKALPGSLRGELENRLGASFADVRVHDDPAAAAEARKHGALAFTKGEDVYFADGKYDPGSTEGRRLIAHELTHVAQQSGAAPTAAPSVSPSGSAVEREADRVSSAFAGGARAGASAFEIRERAPSGTISRDDGSPTKWNMNLMQRALDL